MNWDDARLMLAVYRAGSLSGAAHSLGVNQSTVSRRWSSFETAVGAPVMVRTATGYEPTALGTELVARFEAMEAHMLAAQRRIAGESATVSGTVRITTPLAFGSHYLAPRLGALHRTFPDIELEVVADNTNLSLTKREADLAIRFQRPTSGRVAVRKLAQVGRGLYATRRYLASRPPVGTSLPLDLTGHEMVWTGERYADAPEGRWLARNVKNARIVVRSDTLLVQRGAVLADLGVGFLPHYTAAPVKRLVRCGPAHTVLTRDVWLVVHRDLAQAPRIRAVATFVAELIEGDRALLAGD